MKFCIVGTGRCGTRLLYSMLNDHPDLFVFNETHWIPKLYEIFGTASNEAEAMLDIVRRTHHVTGHPTTAFPEANVQNCFQDLGPLTVTEFCDTFGGFFAHQNGKTAWADKTPDYGPYTSQIQVYWPNCKIIHLIRDGVAVAKSMSRHIGFQCLATLRRYNWCSLSLDYPGNTEGFEPQPMQAFADLWHQRLIRTRDESRRLSPGTYLEVRHEDIINSPTEVLRKIADFVEIHPDNTWLSRVGSLIDAQRVSRPRPIEFLQHFNDTQKQLLVELGYGTK